MHTMVASNGNVVELKVTSKAELKMSMKVALVFVVSLLRAFV